MRTATIAAVLAVAALGGCKVKVKDPGELPKVNVAPGKMPDVEVTTDSVQMPHIKAPEIKAPNVKLPDVKAPDIHAPKIQLPDVDRHARTDTTRRP
jgi:acyl-homoserine lactone acylase PvdQ